MFIFTSMPMKHSYDIHVSSSSQEFSHAHRVKFLASRAVVVFFWEFCLCEFFVPNIGNVPIFVCGIKQVTYIAGKELLDTC